MTVEKIPLQLIDDNPFQPRSNYPRQKIDDMAISLLENGLLQVPLARRSNGRVQLAFGHVRKRAFEKNTKEDAKRWSAMPLDIRDLTDNEMALFALEENLKRTDITPLETARAIDNFITQTGATEVAIARKINMTQGNVANMRRVLRLPEKILEKIDEGKINFTMARELLVLEGLDAGVEEEWSQKDKKPMKVARDGEWLMKNAVSLIGGKSYSACEATVDGMQKAIHSVVSHYFKTLQKHEPGTTHYYAGEDLLFDTSKAGCDKCDHVVHTHPTKGQTTRFCTNVECWDKHQEEYIETQAKAAKEHLQQEIMEQVAKAEQGISQEIPVTAKKGQNPLDDMLEEFEAEVEGETDYWRDQFGTSFGLITLSTLAKDIYSLCGRCTYHEECITKAKRLATDQGEFLACPNPKVINREVRITPGHTLCLPCHNRYQCDGTIVHAGDDNKLTCEMRIVSKAEADKIKAKATKEIPQELLTVAKDQLGTRAEVLDIRELRIDNYSFDLKQGYTLLNGGYHSPITAIDESDECLKRCTHGFHYAFDSQPGRSYPGDQAKPDVYYVCSDTKCLGRKKGAFTRKQNEKGQALKKAESDAIRQAVNQTVELDAPRMRLIIISLLGGPYASHWYSGSSPLDWFAKKLKIEKQKDDYSNEKLRASIHKMIEKMNEGLAQLIVEFSLEALRYSGDVKEYQVQTGDILKSLGVEIKYKDGERINDVRAATNTRA